MFGVIIAILLVFIVNPVIAYFNAYGVGRIWNSMAAATKWEKAIAVSALIQSVIGFSMPMVAIISFIGYVTKYLNMNEIHLVMDLFWLSVIVPIIGSGLIITIQSVRDAIKYRSFGSIATAAWNVGAMINNIVDMFSNFGSILSDATKRASDDDENPAILFIAIFVVIVSIGSGAALTCLSFKRGQKSSLTV